MGIPSGFAFGDAFLFGGLALYGFVDGNRCRFPPGCRLQSLDGLSQGLEALSKSGLGPICSACG
jgi:hypothetical protein